MLELCNLIMNPSINCYDYVYEQTENKESKVTLVYVLKKWNGCIWMLDDYLWVDGEGFHGDTLHPTLIHPPQDPEVPILAPSCTPAVSSRSSTSSQRRSLCRSPQSGPRDWSVQTGWNSIGSSSPPCADTPHPCSWKSRRKLQSR